MATSNPRITVTFTKHQYDVLKVISTCGGQPMSTFISELVEMALPTFERMAVAMQSLKGVQDAQRQRIVSHLDEAQSALEPILQSAVGQIDLFMAQMEAAAGEVGEDARKRASPTSSEAASAPATNRGATKPKQKPGKPIRARVSSHSLKPKISKKRPITTA